MAEVVAPRSRRTESVPRPATSLPRSLMSRFSTGHLVMIVAGLLGLLLTVAVLRRADERQPVAVAARDLAPGTALTESSVRYETLVHLLGGMENESVVEKTRRFFSPRGDVVGARYDHFSRVCLWPRFFDGTHPPSLVLLYPWL